MIIKAFAKINLRLKVLGITDNYYHNLQMVNCKINLFDKIVIKKIKEKNIIIDMPLVKKEENLVYKIAKKMFEQYNLPNGIYIKIKKNIPIGAGLAGGSADGAAVINAIDKIYKLNLSLEEKRNIALLFGTDIVYCLEEKIALVEKIGDKITNLERVINSNILIINPNFSVLTKDIFRSYDEENLFSKELSLEEIEKMPLDEMIDNDLEEVVFKKYPEVKELKINLKKKGYKYTSMSGSGPTIFVLGNKRTLKKLYCSLKKEYKDYNIYFTKIK